MFGLIVHAMQMHYTPVTVMDRRGHRTLSEDVGCPVGLLSERKTYEKPRGQKMGSLYLIGTCILSSRVSLLLRPFPSQSAVRASCSSDVTQEPALFAGTVHESFRQPGVDFFNMDTSAMDSHDGPTTMRNYLKVFLDDTVQYFS